MFVKTRYGVCYSQGFVAGTAATSMMSSEMTGSHVVKKMVDSILPLVYYKDIE